MPPLKPESDEFVGRLAQVAAERLGEPTAIVDFRRMTGGHAGLTFGMTLETPAGRRRAILKISPAGVRRSGAADLVRQAPLLQALEKQRFPAPALLWADSEDRALGVSYIVMEHVDGIEHFPLNMPDDKTPDDATNIWVTASKHVAQLGQVSIDALPSGWSHRVTLAQDLAAWEQTLRKAPQASWIQAGLKARDALQSTLPVEVPEALVHGDFQPSNLLFERGILRGVIDWDLAHIGSAGLDFGWLAMWADAEYWGPQWRAWCPLALDELRAVFIEVAGRPPPYVRWFLAYAGYRFGAIACMNVHLHRSGRRPDPLWERFASDIPHLFARSEELAHTRREI